MAIFPANIYLLKVCNRNTRKRCEICSKIAMKTSRRSGVFIVNFKYILHLFLVFLLLTLNKQMLPGLLLSQLPLFSLNGVISVPTWEVVVKGWPWFISDVLNLVATDNGFLFHPSSWVYLFLEINAKLLDFFEILILLVLTVKI